MPWTPSDDVLKDLYDWASLKVGDMPNEWGPPLTDVLKRAAEEIETLRDRLENPDRDPAWLADKHCGED